MVSPNKAIQRTPKRVTDLGACQYAPALTLDTAPEIESLQNEREAPFSRWGMAWISLAVALALHVADEALTGFLPLYNQIVTSVRESIPWLPLPTFTFPVWLGGLTALVIVLLALSPLVFRGRRLMRPLAYILAVVMVANAMGHAAASVYWGIWAPGVYSSPILFVASVTLLIATRRAKPSTEGLGV